MLKPKIVAIRENNRSAYASRIPTAQFILSANQPFNINYQEPISLKLGEVNLTINKEGNTFYLVTQHGQKMTLENNQAIGRVSPQGNADLQINNDSISREHCRIEITGNQIVITDLNSSNKTVVAITAQSIKGILSDVQVKYHLSQNASEVHPITGRTNPYTIVKRDDLQRAFDEVINLLFEEEYKEINKLANEKDITVKRRGVAELFEKVAATLKGKLGVTLKTIDYNEATNIPYFTENHRKLNDFNSRNPGTYDDINKILYFNFDFINACIKSTSNDDEKISATRAIIELRHEFNVAILSAIYGSKNKIPERTIVPYFNNTVTELSRGATHLLDDISRLTPARP